MLAERNPGIHNEVLNPLYPSTPQFHFGRLYLKMEMVLYKIHRSTIYKVNSENH